MIGRKPLVVVSQSPHGLGPPGIPPPIWEKMRIAWSDLQGDLLELSAMSTQVIVTHARSPDSVRRTRTSDQCDYRR